MGNLRRVVGWNLRRIRVRCGLSIEALAGNAEVDASHVARIERGTTNSSVDVLGRLSDALGINPLELFRQQSPETKPPKPLRSGRRPKIVPR